jgi:putative tricarboxylic transport membrane protein
VLALVLGPMLETEFRRALVGSRGDWTVLVNRPMAATILALALLMILLPFIGRYWKMWRGQREDAQDAPT